MQKIKVPKDVEINPLLLTNVINKWGTHEAVRLAKLEDYYKGEHEILKREVELDKPNNKIVVNYAKLITDNATGYFMGIPVTYESDDKELIEKVFEILDANVEEDVNFEIAKSLSIAGRAYELMYADEEANVRFKQVDKKTIIPVYSNDIDEKLIFAIRKYQTEDILTGEKTEMAEVYTANEIIHYHAANGMFEEYERRDHYFGEVPVIEYTNNNELMGDFEVVLSSIDAYNKSQSDTANDFEYFTDAYLMLFGMQGTDKEDLRQVKEERVFLLPDNGKAEWLTKQINDQANENHKTRLQKDINRISQVPDLSDEQFAGNVSGEAMKYKLWGLEQIASIKERKFKSPLIKRLRMITHFLNIKGGQYDYNNINLKFHRNIPKNTIELVQMIKDLAGILSEKTQIALLPFIDDADAEIARKDEEQNKLIGEDPYLQQTVPPNNEGEEE
ncbi:phage portal protein [Cytobacillus gottheilii]|uniref:Phage portal protein n=1 Tax=Cytobacillus gottheilii TaxID=859144 RepID=A0ABX8F942_9BACI|nr:phage portal protein [Cytobacillus gottheilii]QVY60943.1 phage portal protein [Cytobacillus gottheilii]